MGKYRVLARRVRALEKRVDAMAAPKPEPIDDEPFVRPTEPSPPTFNNAFADKETVNLRRFLSNPGAAGCEIVARGGRFVR
jgi:hypothetical protein